VVVRSDGSLCGPAPEDFDGDSRQTGSPLLPDRSGGFLPLSGLERLYPEWRMNVARIASTAGRGEVSWDEEVSASRNLKLETKMASPDRKEPPAECVIDDFLIARGGPFFQLQRQLRLLHEDA